MAKAEIKFGEMGGGGSKYYTAKVTPQTGSYTNVSCGFAPKYVVLYRRTTDSALVVNYWDIEADTFTSTTASAFENDAKSSWIPAWAKIGDDGKSIDLKAPSAYYVNVTRVIIVG